MFTPKAWPKLKFVVAPSEDEEDCGGPVGWLKIGLCCCAPVEACWPNEVEEFSVENGLAGWGAAKGFVPAEAVKLKEFDEGAVKVCCCAPLTPFAPNTFVAEFPPKKAGVDCIFEKGVE